MPRSIQIAATLSPPLNPLNNRNFRAFERTEYHKFRPQIRSAFDKYMLSGDTLLQRTISIASILNPLALLKPDGTLTYLSASLYTQKLGLNTLRKTLLMELIRSVTRRIQQNCMRCSLGYNDGDTHGSSTPQDRLFFSCLLSSM